MLPQVMADDFGKFGDEFQPGGAVYRVSGRTGTQKMCEELLRTQLRGRGIPITREVEKEIQHLSKIKALELRRENRAEGVPEKLKELFSLRKKSELEKFCQTLELKGSEFALLIENAGLIGYSHNLRQKTFTPEHLWPSQEEVVALANSKIGPIQGKAKKFTNKVSSAFEQRRYQCCHLFQRKDWWHCFYFAGQDLDPQGNHWKHGKHIHFINFLWQGYSKNQVWKMFLGRSIKLPSLHIRFDYGEAGEA